MTGNELLSVRGLRKSFGGLVAVNELEFSVTRGEIVGLLGPNGSGKTTAMNLISGALRRDRGSVMFKGQRIDGLAAHKVARLGVARTFQLVRVLESMTCIENVEAGFAFRPHGLRGAEARREASLLLSRVGLQGRDALPADQLTYIDAKRLELARALALAPELLLLDEWLAGLNPTELNQGIALIKQLREAGVAVLLVEHVMDAVHALCDRCVVMNAGSRIAEGPTKTVLRDPLVMAAYLGEEETDQGEESNHAHA